MIDYRRAFKIACDLLSGAVLYGVDADKIFEIMMDKDGVVASDSYEEYILNHLQELDHGQYAVEKEHETKDCSDCEIVQACVEAGIRSTSRALDILDKIRAEIEQTRKMYLDMNDIDWLNGCDYVLSVIDKYKAESERT